MAAFIFALAQSNVALAQRAAENGIWRVNISFAACAGWRHRAASKTTARSGMASRKLAQAARAWRRYGGGGAWRRASKIKRGVASRKAGQWREKNEMA
jgi:hypothetical protein